MKGYKLNPDKEHIDKIITSTLKKNGHCPCRLEQNETTLCPCDKFIENGICCCKLFVKIEE